MKRGLARAIGTGQAIATPRNKGDVDVFKQNFGAEAHGYIADGNHWVGSTSLARLIVVTEDYEDHRHYGDGEDDAERAEYGAGGDDSDEDCEGCPILVRLPRMVRGEVEAFDGLDDDPKTECREERSDGALRKNMIARVRMRPTGPPKIGIR